jgi:predicted enzyme related to lactoylglutathione lyase
MVIRSIGQIHITVEDLVSAVEFYRDTLGLTFLFEVPEQQMAFFDVGGVRLYLSPAESPELSSHPLLYLTVDDIDAEYTRLCGSGVDAVGAPHVIHRDKSSELWMAFFQDPEGHPLALMENRRVAG